MQKEIDLPVDKVVEKATAFFTARNYTLMSHTDTMLVFKDGKNINIVILILLLCFGVLLALLYYFLSSDKIVTITLKESKGKTTVVATASCLRAQKDGDEFINSL